jgi:hypothetical protein
MAKELIVKISRRSGHAQAALMRPAPTFKDRREPRGGAQNQSRNFLDESIQDKNMDTASDYGDGW